MKPKQLDKHAVKEFTTPDGEEFKGEIDATLLEFEAKDRDGDIFKSGSLDDWLKENDTIPMYWSHLRSEVIGKWHDFSIEGNFLKAKGTLYEGIRRAGEAVVLIKNEALKGVSIGFDSSTYEYRMGREDGVLDYGIDFIKISLREASLVMEPAVQNAEVTALKDAPMSVVKEYLINKQGLTEEEFLKIAGGLFTPTPSENPRVTVAGQLAKMLAAKE